MNKMILLLFVVIGSTVIHAQTKVLEEEEIVICFIEEQPEFPGGEEALIQFISKNLIYPALAKEMNIVGKVFVQFEIEKDGSVTNVVCKKGIGGGCDEEAVRVVKTMPKWKPGKQNGRPVKVKFILPIKFEIR
jgi:periplasmic protein TonB